MSNAENNVATHRNIVYSMNTGNELLNIAAVYAHLVQFLRILKGCLTNGDAKKDIRWHLLAANNPQL
jgi:hypothetical protein